MEIHEVFFLNIKMDFITKETYTKWSRSNSR